MNPKPPKTQAELDAFLRKAIKSIDDAGKAMSVTRAKVEKAKSSKKGQNEVVAKANRVVGPLLKPSRHVLSLLSGLGAKYPPCKQLGSIFAVSVSSQLSDP
jgi:hypothetical protein